jgi:pimeloyl-ACP methyl ester carboxylesterase
MAKVKSRAKARTFGAVTRRIKGLLKISKTLCLDIGSKLAAPGSFFESCAPGQSLARSNSPVVPLLQFVERLLSRTFSKVRTRFEAKFELLMTYFEMGANPTVVPRLWFVERLPKPTPSPKARNLRFAGFETKYELRNMLCLWLAMMPLIALTQDPAWDQTTPGTYPQECRLVHIPSTYDTARQPAIIYQAQGNQARPLLVSLHSWSGNYTQEDTLAWKCVENNWNYIHPDFRGRNNQFQACGSEAVVQDLEDAIDFMVANGQVDPQQIHVTGTSGGGYATLLMYQRSKHPIRSFSAWVPISDLIAWYYQSQGRGNKYAHEIELCTDRVGEKLDSAEARLRSPVYHQVPKAARKNSRLMIYAGVHDGYTGSVPVSHSLNFYNKVVQDLGGKRKDLIPEEIIEQLLLYRLLPGKQPADSLGGRKIHYQKAFGDKVSVTIFEGTHEMLTPVAFQQIEP